jgi:hypothetical protein
MKKINLATLTGLLAIVAGIILFLIANLDDKKYDCEYYSISDNVIFSIFFTSIGIILVLLGLRQSCREKRALISNTKLDPVGSLLMILSPVFFIISLFGFSIISLMIHPWLDCRCHFTDPEHRFADDFLTYCIVISTGITIGLFLGGLWIFFRERKPIFKKESEKI